MERTPLLDIPLLMPNQMQQVVTHNEAIMALDALTQLAVADRDLASPPAEPAQGDRYIVAADATDAWTGWDDSVAIFLDGAWARLQPGPGWLAWVADESVLVAWNGSAWTVASGGGTGPFATVGINTEADATNRLAIKADAALFSHDDVTPGSGDMRMIANKATAGDTVSFLFQSGWEGRAEFGLAGSDDFSLKVSPDGEEWHEAMVVDRDSGEVSFPNTATGGGSSIQVLTAEGTTGTSMASLVYVAQTWDSTTRNDFGGGAWDGTIFTAPANGVYDLCAVLSCTTTGGGPTQADMHFLKNGSLQLGFMKITNGASQNVILSRVVAALDEGDTIAARMRQNSANTQSGLEVATFSIVRLA